MLSSVARSLTEALLTATPTAPAYRVETLTHLPPIIRAVLEQRLHEQVSEVVHEVYHAADWFESAAPEVQEALHRLQDAAQQQARIPADAWPTLLAEATREALDYLVDPQSTLAQRLDTEGGLLTAPAVTGRVGALSTYGYFAEVLTAYLDDRGPQVLAPDRLRTLLQRIDRQMTADYGADRWLRLLAPLLATLHPLQAEPGAPAGLLARFFEAKQHPALAQAFAQMAPDAWLDREALYAQVDRTLAAPAVPTVRDPDPVKPSPVEPPRTEASPPAAEETKNTPKPLWQTFQRNQPEATVPPPPATPESSGEPRWKQFQRPAAEATELAGDGSAAASVPSAPSDPATLADLEATLFGQRGMRNRTLFVDHLFDGSPMLYEAVLRQLQDAETWQEASRIIAQEVFRKHRVNIYSDPAVAFTDAVEARYRGGR
ncbi:MAG: hypothetical protein AAGI71_11725 [Bacteroidota bacterium]